ncbi:MAG: sensor domain-containing diguanylate cyclase [Actinobacteria bacterium]|nr:sensor domain-containing diguanylate cyclase [Actinomycetota bacterium]
MGLDLGIRPADLGGTDGRALADVLVGFTPALLTDRPVDDISRHLCEGLSRLLPVAGVTLMVPASGGPRTLAEDGAGVARWLHAGLEQSPADRVLATGEPLRLLDLAGGGRWCTYRARARSAGLAGVSVLPLILADGRTAAVELYETGSPALDQAHLAVAHLLTDVAAAHLRTAGEVDDLRRAGERGWGLALHDPVTGLPNRLLLIERVRHALGRASREALRPAVLFCDLDGFKAVNDRFGHAAGDRFLNAVADRLLGVLRPGDTLARMGGDEFVVLCEDVRTVPDAVAVARRLLDTLAPPFEIDHCRAALSASVGVAVRHEEAGEDVDGLLRRADLAMYRAKRRGGARLALARRSFSVAARHRGRAAPPPAGPPPPAPVAAGPPRR